MHSTPNSPCFDIKTAIQVHPISDWFTSVTQAHALANVYIKQKKVIVGILFFGTASQVVADSHAIGLWQNWQHCPLLVCQTWINELDIQPNTSHPFKITGLGQWDNLISQGVNLISLP